jgi:Endonuclease NucS C-terminal domain
MTSLEKFTTRELPKRILDILSEARAHFQSDRVRRGDLKHWYEQRYGYRWPPSEIVKNRYMKVPGQPRFYWLDPKKMNDAPSNDEPIEDDGDDASDDPNVGDERATFGLEHQLRDFIAGNLSTIRMPSRHLRLFIDSDGRDGVEYPSAVGPIDILAVDDKGAFFVFELKKDVSPDKTIGQLSRYMGWVKRTLASAGMAEVYGVIVAAKVPHNLRYGISVFPNVYLFEYEVDFKLKPAHELPSS